MPTWIVNMVVAFVLRQVAKYAGSTDWEKVKADALARFAKMVPAGLMPTVTDIVDAVVDVVAAALADTEDLQGDHFVEVFAAALADTEDLNKVVALVIAGDMAGAVSALVDLIVKVVHPHSGAVVAALK